MHPHLVSDVPAYWTFLSAGVLIGVAAGIWRLQRAGLPLWPCVRLEILLSIAGLLGAKLYSLWERGGGPAWAASELTASYRYPGGIIAVTIVLISVHRRVLRGVPLGRFADAAIPATGFAMATVRLGCFAYGCCFGRATDLPWAMRFPAHSPVWNFQVAAGWVTDTALMSLPVHPLQLYFAFASIAVAALAWCIDRYKTFPGQTALVFLILDGLAKLGLETLRGEPVAHLQVAAFATACTAAVGLLITAILAPRVPIGVAFRTPEGPTALNVHSTQRN